MAKIKTTNGSLVGEGVGKGTDIHPGLQSFTAPMNPIQWFLRKLVLDLPQDTVIPFWEYIQRTLHLTTRTFAQS